MAEVPVVLILVAPTTVVVLAALPIFVPVALAPVLILVVPAIPVAANVVAPVTPRVPCIVVAEPAPVELPINVAEIPVVLILVGPTTAVVLPLLPIVVFAVPVVFIVVAPAIVD